MVHYDEESPTKLIWVKHTYQNRIGKPAGSQKPNEYGHVNLGGKLKRIHQVVWEIHHGNIPSGMEIDHINRIKSDNRIENLRLVTKSKNMLNTNSINVSLDKRRNTYYVRFVTRWGRKNASGFLNKEQAIEFADLIKTEINHN